jgi:chromosome segregation ATPase
MTDIEALRATIAERDAQIELLRDEIHNLNKGFRELLQQNEQLRTELREAQRYAKLVTERGTGV